MSQYYKKNSPENAFWEVVSTRNVYGEKWRIFLAQNFSGALRNTRKIFQGLYESGFRVFWKKHASLQQIYLTLARDPIENQHLVSGQLQKTHNLDEL